MKFNMAAAGGITFGAAPNQSSTLFGAQPASTKSSFTFGNPSATTSSFTFGAAAAATTAPSTTLPAFGLGSTASANPGLTLGLSKPAASTTGFSFGAAPAAATSAPSLSFNLGGATSKPSLGLGLGGGLFGSTSTSTPATGLSLGLSQASTIAATSSANTGSTVTDPKENKVAPEITALVDELEKHVKQQKLLKEEIARVSPQAVDKVQTEITELQKAVNNIASGLLKDAAAVENLKGEVAIELRNAEIANNVRQLPATMQHDYRAPVGYFQTLVDSFEARIIECRKEIDEIENYLANSTSNDQVPISSLGQILKQINDTFIYLASQLHSVHQMAKMQKQRYLHYRQVTLNDYKDPFAEQQKRLSTVAASSAGPSPFCGVAGPTAAAFAAAYTAKESTGQKTISTGLPMFGQTSQNPSSISSLTSSLFKPTALGTGTSGLTRSLSFGGGLNQKSTAGSNLFGASLGQSAAGSLFGGSAVSTNKIGFGAASQFTNPTSTFQLGNPPLSSKRGKK